MAKYSTDYGIKDTYIHFKNEGGTVEYKLFTTILKEFYSELSKLMIFKAFDFKMPYRLGRLRIRKYKPKVRMRDDGSLNKSRLRPDWNQTRQLWERSKEAKEKKQLVYHTNKHTNGYQHRFFWEKRTSNIPNHSAYSFLPCRNNKRTLAKVLTDEDSEVDFFE